MFSLEHVLAIFGDPLLGDRLEKLAYNPLPGTFDKAMWAHQYDQQVNQVLCDLYPRQWTTNGPQSNPLRPRAQLRLLHQQPAPGLAQVRRQPLDGHAG